MEPDKNTELVHAIEELQRRPGAQAHLAFWTAFSKAELYVIFEGEYTADAIGSAGVFEFRESVPASVALAKDGQGKQVHVVFTDAEAVRAWTSEAVSIVFLSFPDYCNTVLTVPSDWTGIVINPGSHSFFVPRETLVKVLTLAREE